MCQPRHALSDDQWAALQDLHLFPANGRPGRPWKNHRHIIDGILWILHTGSPWRDLPDFFGPWKTVHGRFNRWRKNGLWDALFSALQGRAQALGLLDWEMFCIDGSVVRASRAAAGRRRPRV